MQWRLYVSVLVASLAAFLAQETIAGFVQVELPFNFGQAALTAIFALVVFWFLHQFVMK